MAQSWPESLALVLVALVRVEPLLELLQFLRNGQDLLAHAFDGGTNVHHLGLVKCFDRALALAGQQPGGTDVEHAGQGQQSIGAWFGAVCLPPMQCRSLHADTARQLRRRQVLQLAGVNDTTASTQEMSPPGNTTLLPCVVVASTGATLSVDADGGEIFSETAG